MKERIFKIPLTAALMAREAINEYCLSEQNRTMNITEYLVLYIVRSIYNDIEKKMVLARHKMQTHVKLKLSKPQALALHQLLKFSDNMHCQVLVMDLGKFIPTHLNLSQIVKSLS